MWRPVWLGVLVSCFVMPLSAGQVIRIENPPANASQSTQIQVIVLDSNGQMTEKEYAYDPDTQTIVIDSEDEGDGASIFFPLFETGFLWWGGYWVDYNGRYWDGHWHRINDNDWHNHWNGYWDKHWDNHWHHYWNNHQNDPRFRYKNQEHWQNHSFRGNHGGEGHGDGHGGGHGGGRHR